ncbi:MAG TPA: hypothetical protein VF260_10480 [Bacilli bacterium]
MRMFSFLIGGVCGAAAALWMTRNNRPFMSAMGEAASRWFGANQFANRSNEPQKAAGSNAAGNGQLRDMIKSDSQVKQSVNEILAENGGNTMQ